MASKVIESWKRTKAIYNHEEVVGKILINKILTKNPAIYSVFPFSKGNEINSDSMFADPTFKVTATEVIRTIDKAIGMMGPDLVSLIEFLKSLGAKLRIFGVKAEHYATFEEALIETLAGTVGDAFTVEVKTSWQTFYKIVKTSMIGGAHYDKDITEVLPEAGPLSKLKLPWLVASVLSLIYAGVYVLVVKHKLPPNVLLFGFCVWGSPEIPDKVIKCTKSPINSHIIAFGIDVIMALIALVLCKKDTSPKKKKGLYLASAFIILIHGALHFFLFKGLDCYIADTQKYEKIGYIFFGAFTFFLSLIILGFGFGFKLWIAAASIASTFLVSSVTMNADNAGQYTLPGLFVIVHPLSCITGIFTKEETFSPTVGKWFVVATLVGIIELSDCEGLLRKIGGHFWYDLTLHTAILAALPYFSEKEKKVKTA